MALTLIITPGASNANAYVDASYASEYMAGVPGFADIWSAFTSQVKDAYIVEATRTIDRMAFLGCKVSAGQALEFPRVSIEAEDWSTATTAVILSGVIPADLLWDADESGNPVIPEKVKRATCEIIRWLHREMSSSGGFDDRVPIEETIAGIVTTKWESGRKSNLPGGQLATAEALLRDYLPNRLSRRLVRG